MERFRIVFFGLIVLCLQVACRSRQVATNEVSKTKTVTRIQRDTIIKTDPDSSFYKAWIDCINGKPVLKPSSEIKKAGNYLHVPNVKIEGNELNVDCYAVAQNLFKTWQQQYIEERETATIIRPPIEVEKPLTWWQNLQIYLGRAALLLSVVYLVYRLIKQKLKIN
ncbi:hypothetical protein [Pedobacter jeongneungensis]|uniref:hypothetical protein n=1 Tax=Pedobacter jeongneungensis TaxID=947309 RepID=UPI0013B4637C|nr:hypothetical protein [Pedobacter jeongneungensis]